MSVGKAAQERAREATHAIELRRSEEQARELMRSKEMFFAMVSHEMRTPLTACIGMAEVCAFVRGAPFSAFGVTSDTLNGR